MTNDEGINKKLSDHFRLREFLKDGSLEGVTPEVMKNLVQVANALEAVRKMVGNRPVTITSGFRTPAHNAKVGGSPRSYHLLGKAADFVVEGVTPRVVQEALRNWHGGLGSYATFTHLDIGPKRRWKG